MEWYPPRPIVSADRGIEMMAHIERRRVQEERVEEEAQRIVQEEDISRAILLADGREVAGLDIALARALVRIVVPVHVGTNEEYRARMLETIFHEGHVVFTVGPSPMGCPAPSSIEPVGKAFYEMAQALRRIFGAEAAPHLELQRKAAERALRHILPDEAAKSEQMGFAEHFERLIAERRPDLPDDDRYRLAIRVGECLGTEPPPRNRAGEPIEDPAEADEVRIVRMRQRLKRRS